MTFYKEGRGVSEESPGRVTLKAFQRALSSPQHQILVSVSPFQTNAEVIVFLSLLFEGVGVGGNSILLAASVTSGPLSSPVIQSHLSSFQECTSVILLYLSSLFSPDHGALGSLGAMCVWLPQIYSSSLVKWDTVTSSVSGGPRPRLLSAECQEIGNL